VFRRSLGCFFALMLSLSLSSVAGAETLVLTSGETVIGKIIEKTDMYVRLDSFGTPITYYLGEITSIDGQKIELQKPQKIITPSVDQKQTPLKYGNEEDSLIKFMAYRSSNVASKNKPTDQKVSITPTTPVKDHPMPPTSGAMALAMRQPVVTATPDGGVIVVTDQKIVKYDKDLKFIREVDLKASNPPS